MRVRTVVAIGITAFLLPATGVADSGSVTAPRPLSTAISETIPSYVANYASLEQIRLGMPPNRDEATRASDDGALEMVSFGGLRDAALSEGAPAKKSYRPVLYSLLWPGTGEVALGHPWRGAALITLEVAAWAGYFYYQDQGLDSRAAFEAFADAHWTHDNWIYNHPATQSVSDEFRTFEVLDSIGRNHWTGWPGYHTYAAKDDVKLNYYENIGKYDWFISGWEDWDPNAADPKNTALRTTYRGMRKKSNDELDRADQFVYLSIATRVFSLVETFLLIRMRDPEAPSKAEEGNSFRFTARSTGLYSGEVAFEYRFR